MSEFFEGDEHKVRLWLETPNPMLGYIAPLTMILLGRYKRLLSFVMDAREDEQAAKDVKQAAQPLT